MEELGNAEGVYKSEKPPVLYIGTQNKGIKEFTARRGRYRDKDEGPVIFATPDKALASIFSVDDHNDSWMQFGYCEDILVLVINCLLYTSPSPRDRTRSRMPSSA